MKTFHVLIADDDNELRNWLRLALRRISNLRISEAQNGKELMAILMENQPIDLVIADIRMPHKSGVEVALEVRRLGLTLPFIFITGYDDSEAYEAVDRLGDSVLLSKPVDSIDILNHVRSFLSLTS